METGLIVDCGFSSPVFEESIVINVASKSSSLFSACENFKALTDVCWQLLAVLLDFNVYKSEPFHARCRSKLHFL